MKLVATIEFCVVALLLSKTYHNKRKSSTLLFPWVALNVPFRGLGGRKLQASLANPFAPGEVENKSKSGLDNSVQAV